MKNNERILDSDKLELLTFELDAISVQIEGVLLSLAKEDLLITQSQFENLATKFAEDLNDVSKCLKETLTTYLNRG